MSTPADTCPHCGSADLLTVRCEPPSPHFARTGCRACGRHLRWEPAPVTPERARAFRLPWGKFKGRTVGEVGGTAAGLGYLRWLAGVTEDDRLRRLLRCYLEDRDFAEK